jgi:hypothetical protein
LSIIFYKTVGNDTIDRYPLPCRGRLTKLLCISKEIFERLRLTTREFYARQAIIKSTPARVQRTKALPKVSVLPSHDAKKTTCPEYTPTKIWATRDSALWQWRRAYEWWREYGQDEFINEKGHIY